MRPAALGTSIAALAVSTGSLLAPQAASAVDFTFSFGGVTGLIENLVEGQNTCTFTTPNAPACFVNVTNTGGRHPVGIYTQDEDDASFTVVRGGGSFFLVSADFEGDAPNNIDSGLLIFCYPGSPRTRCAGHTQPMGILVSQAANGVTAVVTFAAVQPPTPSSTSVPGPLPLFGAAAAFGFSRKLRNRIKKSGNSAASTFTLVGR
jgi:hypothetical protein